MLPKSRRAHVRVNVFDKQPSDRLPDSFSEGAVLLTHLRDKGVLERVCELLKVPRQGGYQGIDIFLFFMHYFAGHSDKGLMACSDALHSHRSRLAALGERLHIPTCSSVSRYLDAVPDGATEALDLYLLLEASGGCTLLSEPAVTARDGLGAGWHVFDLDPTSKVLRQRALPEGESLPSARRRAIEALAGYFGRKRGELKVSRTTLQHAGSGLWLGMWTAPGNGDWRNYSHKAIARVREVCTTAGLCYERALIRVDGEGGNTPFITGCQEAGLHYLTRIAAYELFDIPAICMYLNAAVWHEVEDSGSGPKRYAVDLGRIQLPCSPKTLREDGTPFAPVMSRVVVARYRSETGRGAGRLLDGWNYELFATDLEALAYVAPEVVTHYYGRSGEENRFRQEDRELGLDRIYSYHLPGYNLACILGLFLWNLRICWGVLLGKLPQTLPPQLRRALVRASTTVELPLPQTISPQPDKLTQMPAKKASGMALTQPLKVIPKPPVQEIGAAAAPEKAGAPASEPTLRPEKREVLFPDSASDAMIFSEEPVDSGTLLDSSPSVTIGAFEALRDALSRQNWTRLVQYQDGWRMSEDPLGLRCANGEILRLRHVKLLPKGVTGILIFRAQEGVCRECPLRGSCMRPTTQAGAKGAMLSVPAAQAIELDALLKAARTTARWERDSRTPSVRLKGPPHTIQPPIIKGDSPTPPPQAEPPIKPEKSRQKARRPAVIEAILQTWERPQIPVRGAFLRPVQAILLPAAARHLFRRTCRDVEVEVELILPPELERPSPLIAETDATRQRRRLTWEQRLVSNALPIGAQVNVELRLPTHAKALLARAPIPHDKARQPVDVEWD